MWPQFWKYDCCYVLIQYH